jgi:hypothetical protein
MKKQTNLLAALLASMVFAATVFGGSADLKINVSLNPLSPQVADEIHYQCIVTNNGPDAPSSLHGYAGPDNSDGGCNPANPAASCDKYTTFDQSTPAAFFTDSTNFRYFRLLLCTDSTCASTSGPVSTLASGQSGVFDLFYKATTTGTTHRLIGVASDDGGVGDPNQSNNSVTSTLFIGDGSGGSGSPTPPPHGGLSATKFKVNLSTSPAYTKAPPLPPVTGLAGTPLLFSAEQSAVAANASVRVQATTTPDIESSWSDLQDGRSGGMVYVEMYKGYGLISTAYPQQDGVYFRAVASAGGFFDSISNIVGPFNLASNQPKLGALTLNLTAGGTVADFYFTARLPGAPAPTGLRVQSSTTPTDENSWSDLPGGSTMARSANSAYPDIFILGVNNLPAAQHLHFRAIASANGYLDSISNSFGGWNITRDNPPVVTLRTLPGLSGSGDGSAPDRPIILNVEGATFSATVQSTRAIARVQIQVDGATVNTYPGSSDPNATYLAFFSATIGDHIFEAVATDDLGAQARAGTHPLYVRLIPGNNNAKLDRSAGSSASAANADRVFTAVRDGNWRDPATWDRNKGFPGDGQEGVDFGSDFAIIGPHAISIDHDTPVNSVSINGGKVVGLGSVTNLSVFKMITIFSGALQNTYLNNYGICELLSPTDIQFDGNCLNAPGATWRFHGSGGVRGLQDFKNLGTVEWLPPIQVPSLAAVDPAAGVPVLHTANFTQAGEVRSTLTRLLTSDGASLIGKAGASIVSAGGGNLIGHDGASLIGHDGASLIGHDGASLIGHDGASVIGANGSGLIETNGGGGSSASNSKMRAATTPGGYVQNGGTTNLSACDIIGPVTLNGGTLVGTGMIVGDLTNNGGYIAPGNSGSGTIAVIGNLSQASNGTVIIENGGKDPTEFDQLQVAGSASLGGKLDVRLVNGYAPDLADTFNPLIYKSATGSLTVSGNGQSGVSSTGLLLNVDATKPNPAAGRPLNISTRLNVLAGDNTLIAGFIVTGPTGSTKKVLIRGIGPSLAAFGVPGTISDPLLELHKPDNTLVSNDNWEQGDPSLIPAGFAPTDSRESVIVATLAPGNYSAVLKGAHGETGVGLAEVYDLDATSAAQLANISTRGFVNIGDDVMIGGFIVAGSEPAKVLVRAIGPSLTAFGVQGALPATTLEVHDANGAVIRNDGWRNTQESDIIATTIPPTNDNEAAILATLVPGNYTAVVRGRNNATGIGLVEAYNLQ